MAEQYEMIRPRGIDWFPIVGFVTYGYRVLSTPREEYRKTLGDFVRHGLPFDAYHAVWTAGLLLAPSFLSLG